MFSAGWTYILENLRDPECQMLDRYTSSASLVNNAILQLILRYSTLFKNNDIGFIIIKNNII